MYMSRYDESQAPETVRPDFSKRKRHGNIKVMGALYLLTLALVIASIMYRDSFGSETIFFLVLVGLVTAQTLHALYSLQRNLDLVTEVEFQNALFSSGIRKNCDFSLILKGNGNFAFTDDGFKGFFPAFSLRNNGIEAFIDVIGLANSEAERLAIAMREHKHERFLFPMKDENGGQHQMILNIYPLMRPKDYFLIQGRKFVERGVGGVPKITPDNQKYIDYLLHNMPQGTYVASPSGHIRFMNHVLENWLGYNEGEAIDKALTIDDLIYTSDNVEKTDISLEDYSGELKLARKNGSLLHTTVDQHTVKDADNNVMAVFGMIKKVD